MNKLILIAIFFLNIYITMYAQTSATVVNLNPKTLPLANGTIYAVAIQTDGKIIVGGAFNAYDGISRNGINRINIDGSLDNSFIQGPAANNTVHAVALQKDGKIIIGGSFTSYDTVDRNHVARLNIDGTLDETFKSKMGANDIVYSVAVQANGKIMITGSFTSYDGISRKGIARLNTNGSLDLTFDLSMVDGKISKKSDFKCN